MVLSKVGEVARKVTQAVEQAGYTVKRGDTLSGIAKSLGVSVDALVQANPHLKSIKDTALKAGSVLQQPAARLQQLARAAGESPVAAPVRAATASVQSAANAMRSFLRGEDQVRDRVTPRDATPEDSQVRAKSFLDQVVPDAGPPAAPSLDAVRQGAVMEQGQAGDAVRDVQARLGKLGYGVEASGTFDASTTEAVRRFQADHGVEQTAKMGPTTLGVLEQVERAAPSLEDIRGGKIMQQGQTGAPVTEIQQRLGKLGYGVEASGTFDASTTEAVRRFQADHGVEQTAKMGPTTLGVLEQVERDAQVPEYDGRTPAAGTTNTRAWIPVDAPFTNDAGHRSAKAYDEVLDQFAVGDNPRYAKREGNTYCNIFAWDATKAMGAELPHWVDSKGNPAAVGARGAYEQDANGVNGWLNSHGGEHGWRQVSADEAQAMANGGHPAVASWNNPGGIGHIGMIRPGEVTGRGPALAQAGGHNFNQGHVQDGFGGAQPQYWVHD